MRMVRAACWFAILALAGTPARALEARGHFDVTVMPAPGAPGPVGRFLLSKTYHGDVEGRSLGEMLASGSPSSGEAGYVAMERVDGRVGTRTGSFVLQQIGAMEGGRTTMQVSVVPGSGTGMLRGIRGSMTVDPAAGHAYVLTYSVP